MGQVEAWGEQSAIGSKVQWFEGGHKFLLEDPGALLTMIENDLLKTPINRC